MVNEVQIQLSNTAGKNPLAKALGEFGKAARMIVIKTTIKSDDGARERKGSVAMSYRTSAVEHLKRKESKGEDLRRDTLAINLQLACN